MKNQVVLAEGKTKIIRRVTDMPGFVNIKSKNEITKNDDPSQTQVMNNKAIHSTTTTCAVFSLLKDAGISVAFEKQISETEFLAPECQMIALEVIVRRYAVGSYLKRFPNLEQKGEVPYRFHRLVFELFLKTTGGKVTDKGGASLGSMPNDESTGRPVDDPFISNYEEETWELRHPKIPAWDKKSDLHFRVLRNNILPEGVTTEMIEEIARKTFLVLEGAWAGLGCHLIDFKIEFGIGSAGNLLVADVIDNDSWRLRTNDWQELSKQLFRDNAKMEDIADKYALVASLVNRFTIPK
ncbi:MAG: phosphoribosylaminoimidazolesuccinocarboxamide synthase [bacterium]|nr:phosphoribosylaminoimidazolesuccinocarboxamide synthase [bacterium]